MQLFSGIKEKLSEYVDTKLRLYQMDIEERVSELISNLVYVFILAGIVLIGFLFLLIFLVNVINYWTENPFLGYGIMASICVILLVILTRENVQLFITNKTKEKIILTIKTKKMETKSRITFDYDDEKAKLINKSASLENDIEQNIEKIKDYIQENGKNALVIGGSLLATYLLLRLITSSSDEKTVHSLPHSYANATGQPVVHVVREEEESPIIKQIKTSIALFLVSIAKQKLQEFIENYGKDKTKTQ